MQKSCLFTFVPMSECTGHEDSVEFHFILVGNFPGFGARALQLILPSTGGHMLECHSVLQVQLSEEAKTAWQLEQLHR